MSGEGGAWVLMTLPNGSRALVNLELTFMFSENADGTATAVSLAGLPVGLGERFQTVMDDLGEYDATESRAAKTGS